MKIAEIVSFLRPNGGWVIQGDEYEGITFIEAQPFTKAEFEATKPKVEAAKTKLEAEKQAKKQALLDRLGITEEEARLLLS